MRATAFPFSEKERMKRTIRIGEKQNLSVLRETDHGVYLGTGDTEESVLLPKKQVPEGTKHGDECAVFVYRDSEDRLIATTHEPYVTLGGFAWLAVRSVTKIGAFLDWGLEKDLFLPFSEQEEPVKSGTRVLVTVYLDRSERLAATTKVYDRLSSAPAGLFKKNGAFSGFVYRTQKEIGAFVAVADPADCSEDMGNRPFSRLYFGLIPADQVFQKYRVGDPVKGRVVRVREDGKLDLSVRGRVFEQLDADGEAIVRKIGEYGGRLPFSEKASPEIIKRELHMSKNGFKKALGHLWKQGRIEILEDSVILKPSAK